MSVSVYYIEGRTSEDEWIRFGQMFYTEDEARRAVASGLTVMPEWRIAKVTTTTEYIAVPQEPGR